MKPHAFNPIKQPRSKGLFKASEFPKAYIPEVLSNNIQRVRTYYSVLENSPPKGKKSSRSNSPVKAIPMQKKINFHFRSVSHQLLHKPEKVSVAEGKDKRDYLEMFRNMRRQRGKSMDTKEFVYAMQVIPPHAQVIKLSLHTQTK